MSAIALLRAILAAGGIIGTLARFVTAAFNEYESKLKGERERANCEINRLQRQVNALICNGFQFEVRGQPGRRQIDQAAVRANWQRGYTVGRLLDVAAAETCRSLPLKDYMSAVAPFDEMVFEDFARYSDPRAVKHEMAHMLTGALLPHIMAAICEIRGDSETASKIRESLERDRKDFCR